VEDTAETFFLTPAQVHAALAYYYDHQQEMESLIDEWERELDDEEFSEREIAALAGATHMTVTQVAEEFGLDDSTVRKAIYEKRLPAVKAGGVWLVARKGAEKLWREKGRRGRPRKPRQK
jgi:excisionase family DNA binding protein